MISGMWESFQEGCLINEIDVDGWFCHVQLNRIKEIMASRIASYKHKVECDLY